MTNNEIYFDNAATTRPAQDVLSAVLSAMSDNYGNPSSLHNAGIMAERTMNEARVRVAGLFGVESERVFFTSGGTESANTAIFGVCLREARVKSSSTGVAHVPRRIVTTRTEHPATLRVVETLAERGLDVCYIPVSNDGLVELDALSAAFEDKNYSTALIALTHVNNETGVVQPIREASRIRDEKCPSAILFVDCVQSFGKLDVSPKLLGADLVSASAHKLHGPKGIGALFVGDRVHIPPLIYGGGQESGLRSGTENLPAITGFGVAADLAAAALKESGENTSLLRDTLIDRLSRGNVKYIEITRRENTSPYILTLSFPGIPAEVLLNHLSAEGIYVSSGSACSAKRREKAGSHVLNAMRLPRTVIESAIRVSFGRDNTVEEVLKLADMLGALAPALTRGIAHLKTEDGRNGRKFWSR